MTSPLQAAYNEVTLTNSRLRAALEMSELARDRALAEVERLNAERAGDQQRLFHYEAEIERLNRYTERLRANAERDANEIERLTALVVQLEFRPTDGEIRDAVKAVQALFPGIKP
jgi:hypothetical protein